MKRILCITTIIMLIMNSTFISALAEESGSVDWINQENEQVVKEETTVITKQDISRGLSFCREYPVTVQIDGVNVSTNQGDVPPVIIASRTLIPARAFFESMGANVSWNDEERKVTVTDEERVVELTIDSDITKVDGNELKLDVPALIVDHDDDGNGSTMVPLRFVSEGLGYQVTWEDETRTANVINPIKPEIGEDTSTFSTDYGQLHVLNDNAREKLIVIDIGHGGRDTGSIANEDMPDELYEKDVNLEIGLILKEYLEQAQAKFIFTREKDEYIQLHDRPAFANAMGADIVVSIHNNSSDYSKPEGTEVYYYGKVNENEQDELELYGIYSKDVAILIQQEMVSMLETVDRGAKESSKLAVLNKTSMPAIIVEGAFMSNPDDLEKIRTNEFKQKYAYAVAKGLITGLNRAF